jgi:hypothetical protein
MNNADMPAMPLSGDAYQDFAGFDGSKNTSYNPECQGLTKREQFCLQMGVPETGDPELDDIIRKGERKRIAAMAMQGLIAADYKSGSEKMGEEDITLMAISYADNLLKGLDK